MTIPTTMGVWCLGPELAEGSRFHPGITTTRCCKLQQGIQGRYAAVTAPGLILYALHRPHSRSSPFRTEASVQTIVKFRCLLSYPFILQLLMLQQCGDLCFLKKSRESCRLPRPPRLSDSFEQEHIVNICQH